MAYNLVASTSKGVDGGQAGPTSAINTTGANLIVVGIHQSSWLDSLPDITDNKGNTYTYIFVNGAEVPSNCLVGLYYCLTPTVGSGHTFNIANSPNAGAVISVLAFSGAPTSAVVDVITANAISTYFIGTIQPGSIVPAGDDQLFVTAFCIGAHTLGGWADMSSVATIDSGFTKQEQVLGLGTWLTDPRYMNGAIAYKIQTTGHSENPVWSWGVSDTIAAVAMVTFKPSSETPSEPQPPFGGHIGPLAWVHWPRRIPGGATIIETYSDWDMQCPGSWENGFKDGVIESWGEAERSASHPRTGDPVGSTFTFRRSDTDRLIRQDMAGTTRRYWPDPLQVNMTDRATRAVLGTPYTVFVGLISDMQFAHPLHADITLTDLASQTLLPDQFQTPWRMIGDGFLDQFDQVSENLDRNQPEPIIYGRHIRVGPSTEGSPAFPGDPASAHGYCIAPPYLGIMTFGGLPRHVWLVAGHACAGFPTIRVDGVERISEEGTDWFVPHYGGWNALFGGNPYVDLRSSTYGNGRRYSLILGTVTDMGASPDSLTDPDACALGVRQLTVAVLGTEDRGDGFGELILKRPLAYKHFAIHYLGRRGIDSYQTGLWADHPNAEWNLFEGTVPIIDEESFDTVDAIADDRLPALGSPEDPAGYLVAAIIGARPSDRSSNRRWIAEWNRSCGVRSGWTHLSQFRIGMLHPTQAVKAAARVITDSSEILEDGFGTAIMWDLHATRVPFKTDFDHSTGVWRTVDAYTSDQAAMNYSGTNGAPSFVEAEPMEYPFAPGITAAFHLARIDGLMHQHPPRVVTIEETIGPDPLNDSLGYLDLFDYVLYRCFDAVSNSPSEIRLGWIISHSVQVETRKVRVKVLDCEDLIDFDLPEAATLGSPTEFFNETCAEAIDMGDLSSPYSTTIDTTHHATDDSLTSSPGFGGSGIAYHAAWFKMTGNIYDGVATFSALGSSYDTQMLVMSGSCGSLTPVDYNDNFGGGNTSLLDVNIVGGTDYFIMIAGYSEADRGLLQFSAVFTPNP